MKHHVTWGPEKGQRRGKGQWSYTKTALKPSSSTTLSKLYSHTFASGIRISATE